MRKTVLITGGNTGIGYAIAPGFVTASAKRVIILGRRPDVVRTAAKTLAGGARQLDSGTAVEERVCDISSLESTASLWASLEEDAVVVDVLVLNAASHGATAPILQSGRDMVWADFETSVRSGLDFIERFYKQEGPGKGTQKFVVNLSSVVRYMWAVAADRPSYGLTKSASTLLVQQIAKDTDVKDMYIVSFSPGGVLAQMARNAGYNEESGITFDDENLVGPFAVWAASPEAERLHGRFVWASWDVNEIMSGAVGKQIQADPNFLKVGIEGLSESMGNPAW